MALQAASHQDHTEGQVARTIEQQTAKLPSDTFLWAAVASMVTSATFQLMGKRHVSVFIGQWAPTFLIFGLYNKLVKQHGSDYTDQRERVRNLTSQRRGTRLRRCSPRSRDNGGSARR